MATNHKKSGFNCNICKSVDLVELKVGTLLFPSTSYAPDFHQYKNFLCQCCGVVASKPEPTDKELILFYNSAYRKSDLSFEADGKTIDTSINLYSSGRSFRRAKNFYETIQLVKQTYPDAPLKSTDTILDIGAYQGFFLHAVSKIWDPECIAVDYNEKGIEFAKQALGFEGSWVTKNLYKDRVKNKVKVVTMVHVLEHLRDPLLFLSHLRKNILLKDGLLYIEVPNLYGTPLNDPTHFFTFNRQSLSYLLCVAGFEILSVRTTGEPLDETFIARSEEENLICLAKVSNQQFNPSSRNLDAQAFSKDLQRKYLYHSRKGVFREIIRSSKTLFRFCGYFVFVVVLESASIGLAKKIIRFLRLRSI